MKIMPVLRFLRVSALPSAWADVLGACALLAGLSSHDDPREIIEALPIFLVVSTCLYLGGMGLNDLLHIEKDTALKKNRPIPSGQLSADMGAAIVAFLFATGWAAAVYVSVPFSILVLMLSFLIFLYNWLSAGEVSEGTIVPTPIRIKLSVPTIAMCRVLHVALPLMAFGATGLAVVFIMVSTFIYFTLVTAISLFEDKGGGRRVFALVDLLLIPTVFAFPVLLMTRPMVGDVKQVMYWGALLVLLALLTKTHGALSAAMEKPTPPIVGKAVGTGIRGNCLFMAAIALAAAPAQPYWGIACILLFFVGGWAGKYVSPT